MVNKEDVGKEVLVKGLLIEYVEDNESKDEGVVALESGATIKAPASSITTIHTNSLDVPLKFRIGDRAVKCSRGEYSFVIIDAINHIDIEMGKPHVYYSVSNDYSKISSVSESKLLTLDEFGRIFQNMK